MPAAIRSLSLVALVALLLPSLAPAASLPPPLDEGPVGARLLWHSPPGAPLPAGAGAAVATDRARHRYVSSGASSGSVPGHTPVEDTRTGEVVAWVPMFPGRPLPRHIWAYNDLSLSPRSQDPADHDPCLAGVAREMNRTWPGAWAEQDATYAGSAGTAFLPLPAQVFVLPETPHPRILLKTADGHYFAWELHPVRAPEPKPYPPPIPIHPRLGEARLLWQRGPTVSEGHEPTVHFYGGLLESAPEAGWIAVNLCSGALQLRSADDGRVEAVTDLPELPHPTPGDFTYVPRSRAWVLHSWEKDHTDWRVQRWVIDRDSLDLRQHRIGRARKVPASLQDIDMFGMANNRRRLPTGPLELVRKGATLHVLDRDRKEYVGPPMPDSPWGMDLVADPTGRYVVTGAPLPDGQGRAAVWDRERGEVVAWLPTHPELPTRGFGWARSHGLAWGRTQAEAIAPFHWVPEHLRTRAAPLEGLPGGWHEFDFPDESGRLRTALLPEPVQVAALPWGRGPRFVTMNLEGILTAWEVTLPEPEPEPEPEPTPPESPPPRGPSPAPQDPPTHTVTIEAIPPLAAPARTTKPANRPASWLR